MLLAYFSALPNGKLALWCYLIWYLGMLTFNFNPSAEIWLNSLGISLVVGYALFLSIAKRQTRPLVLPHLVSGHADI